MFRNRGDIVPEMDIDTEYALRDLFLTLSIPNALDPDGFFANLPNAKQEELGALLETWHMNHWIAWKHLATKPTLF